MQLLEPHGAGNHEPAFAARGVRLIAPPKILKDKHIKLKLKAGENDGGHEFSSGGSDEKEDPSKEELSAVAILATPNCHPDGAAIRRKEKAEAKGFSLRTENRELRTVKTVFNALGWHMAERLQQSPLLAGDAIDIAFSIGHNDHPDFGGLELSLRDFRSIGRPTGKRSKIRQGCFALATEH